MASVNKVIIVGNLGKDVEIHQLQSTSVANFSVATTEKYTKDGQTVEETEWHNVTVWGKTAENCAKYLAKGSAVYVEGKLKTEKYTDKHGVERYTTKVIAQRVQFLSSPKGQQGQPPAQQAYQQPTQGYQQQMPQPGYQPQFPPAQQPSHPQYPPAAPPSANDIPF